MLMMVAGNLLGDILKMKTIQDLEDELIDYQ